MAAAIAEPAHLAAELKALHLSTVAAPGRAGRPPASDAGRLPRAAGAPGGDRTPGAPHPAPHPGCLLPDAEDPGRLLVRGAAGPRPRRRPAGLRLPFRRRGWQRRVRRRRGTGKSHLSIALGMACCQHDYRVRFVTATELVTLLVAVQQQGRLARKLAQLARFDIVHVDELGYVPLDASRRGVRHDPGSSTVSVARGRRGR